MYAGSTRRRALVDGLGRHLSAEAGDLDRHAADGDAAEVEEIDGPVDARAAEERAVLAAEVREAERIARDGETRMLARDGRCVDDDRAIAGT